ncbi:MAG: glycosyltransferase [Odoribacter sp.]
MKLRILQIINNLGSGGAEKLISDFSSLISQREYHIEVLLLKRQDSLYIELLQESGVKVKCLSEFSLYSLSHIFKIRQYIRKGNFDIVHVHIFPALYFAALASFLGIGKAKLCFTEHNTTNKRMENKLFHLIDKWIYTFYQSVICITDEVKSNIQSHLQNDKIDYVTVLNGVNLNSFELPLKSSKESLFSGFSDKTIITMVARFSEQKDQFTVIQSMNFLPENIHLLLVGEGPLKDSLYKIADESNLLDRIHFFGLRKDVPDILRLSDIGVLSSNWEGMPLAGIEIMAAGIPFIGSDVPGINELVNVNPNAGLLFKKGNSEELALHINQLLNDSEYYAQRANACKKQAQEYSIEKMVDGYLNVYERMLNED